MTPKGQGRSWPCPPHPHPLGGREQRRPGLGRGGGRENEAAFLVRVLSFFKISAVERQAPPSIRRLPRGPPSSRPSPPALLGLARQAEASVSLWCPGFHFRAEPERRKEGWREHGAAVRYRVPPGRHLRPLLPPGDSCSQGQGVKVKFSTCPRAGQATSSLWAPAPMAHRLEGRPRVTSTRERQGRPAMSPVGAGGARC